MDYAVWYHHIDVDEKTHYGKVVYLQFRIILVQPLSNALEYVSGFFSRKCFFNILCSTVDSYIRYSLINNSY